MIIKRVDNLDEELLLEKRFYTVNYLDKSNQPGKVNIYATSEKDAKEMFNVALGKENHRLDIKGNYYVKRDDGSEKWRKGKQKFDYNEVSFLQDIGAHSPEIDVSFDEEAPYLSLEDKTMRTETKKIVLRDILKSDLDNILVHHKNRREYDNKHTNLCIIKDYSKETLETIHKILHGTNYGTSYETNPTYLYFYDVDKSGNLIQRQIKIEIK